MTADLAARWRGEFPILAHKTYLCSHSLGAVPRATRQALNAYYDAWATLGIEAWDGPWWQAVDDFAADIGAILNAPAGSIVPMQNVTRAFAAVASCLDYSQRRRKIVLTSLEFTTSYPFWRAQERAGAELVVVPSDDGITVPVERLCEAIDERTVLVPTSHVYFRSGALQELETVVRRAHQVGAWVMGDGYQAVGTVPVDVQALNVDFYAGGSHKWLCGGPGAGFLYVRPVLAAQLRPRMTGWFGLKDPFSYEPGTDAIEPADGARRFLGGTPNVPGLYAAREGVRIVRDIGVDAIRARSQEMTTSIIEQADARGLQVRTPRDPERRSGMVCLEFDRSEAICKAMVERGIILDWRPDCGVRVSPHFYSTDEDLAVFFEALDDLR